MQPSHVLVRASLKSKLFKVFNCWFDKQDIKDSELQKILGIKLSQITFICWTVRRKGNTV